MSTVTHYNGFYTIDELRKAWWRRDVFFQTTAEVGLLLLQDNYTDSLNIGLVVGANEREALNQVNYTTFDQTIGDSEIIRALSRLLTQDELVPLMKHTAKERNKNTLATKGNPNYAFDMAVCRLLKGVGFYEEAGILKMDL